MKGVLEVTFIQYPTVHNICPHYRQRNSTWTENKFIHRKRVDAKKTAESDSSNKASKADDDPDGLNQFQRLAMIPTSDVTKTTKSKIPNIQEHQSTDYVAMAEIIENDAERRTKPEDKRNLETTQNNSRADSNPAITHSQHISTLATPTGYLDMTGTAKQSTADVKGEVSTREDTITTNNIGHITIHADDSTTRQEDLQMTRNEFDKESVCVSEDPYTDTAIDIDSFSTASSDYNTIRSNQSNDYNTIDSTSTRTTNSNYAKVMDIVDIDIGSETSAQTDGYLNPVDVRTCHQNEETVAEIHRPRSDGIYITTGECTTNTSRTSGYNTAAIVHDDIQSITDEQDDLSEHNETRVFVEEDSEERCLQDVDNMTEADADDDDDGEEEDNIDEKSSPSVFPIIQMFQYGQGVRILGLY